MTFDMKQLYRDGLPTPAASFGGYPKFNFVGGHNDAASIPVSELIAAVQRSLEVGGRTLATYGMTSGPQGHLPLREFIARRMTDSAGMSDTAREVLVTSGSLQALDLVFRLLLTPGDAVIVENATYGGALARLRREGAVCLGVRQDEAGIDPVHLEQLLSEQQAAGCPAKLIYTIPTVQNPTGGVMSLQRRHEVLALAERFGCAVFEDDCYADLLWDGERPPALRALDRSGRVIYCGSFSKSIAPALRVGYLVADETVLLQLLPLKTDAGTGALEQMVLAEFCAQHFASHVEQLTHVLQRKSQVMVAALQENFGAAAEFEMPKGGIFIWISLPHQIDTTILAAAAIEHGVALNPGADWTVDGENNRHRMRLCFGHPDEQTIREGVAKLAEICHARFGVPERGSNRIRQSRDGLV